MTYRVPALDIPSDEPFKNDALQRRDIVEFIAGLIKKSGEAPLVIGIDGSYGSGKTTFVGMLNAVLTKENYQTINFDAWRADHISDPLIAMVAALDNAIPKENGMINAGLGIVKKLAGSVAKRGVVMAAKAATLGALDLQEEYAELAKDLAGEISEDLVGEFQKEEKRIDCFRSELARVIKQLASAGKKESLIFFVDELDRCRPDFAISLLERIKHMFDVQNIVFVLSIDKAQLEAAIASVYGERINATEYLRKFIDLEFGLSSPANKKFLDLAITRIGLDGLLQARSDHPETRNDREYFVDTMYALSNIFDLSLRAQERCITRLKLVIEQTATNQLLNPEHVALLIVLRQMDNSVFNKVVKRYISPEELLMFLQEQPGGKRVLASDDGRVLHALVLAEDNDRDRLGSRIHDLRERLRVPGMAQVERNKLSDQINLIEHFSNRSRGRTNLISLIAGKIDIASNIRD